MWLNLWSTVAGVAVESRKETDKSFSGKSQLEVGVAEGRKGNRMRVLKTLLVRLVYGTKERALLELIELPKVQGICGSLGDKTQQEQMKHHCRDTHYRDRKESHQ